MGQSSSVYHPRTQNKEPVRTTRVLKAQQHTSVICTKDCCGGHFLDTFTPLKIVDENILSRPDAAFLSGKQMLVNQSK